jgi:hypothetical protein
MPQASIFIFLHLHRNSSSCSSSLKPVIRSTLNTPGEFKEFAALLVSYNPTKSYLLTTHAFPLQNDWARQEQHFKNQVHKSCSYAFHQAIGHTQDPSTLELGIWYASKHCRAT